MLSNPVHAVCNYKVKALAGHKPLLRTSTVLRSLVSYSLMKRFVTGIVRMRMKSSRIGVTKVSCVWSKMYGFGTWNTTALVRHILICSVIRFVRAGTKQSVSIFIKFRSDDTSIATPPGLFDDAERAFAPGRIPAAPKPESPPGCPVAVQHDGHVALRRALHAVPGDPGIGPRNQAVFSSSRYI